MSRIVDRHISVELNPDHTPRVFRYRTLHRVKEILDRWVEAGEWWDGDGEKEVFRVATDDGGIFELSREVGKGLAVDEWRLYKIYD